MLQRDFLMRQIQQLTQALSQVMAQRADEQNDEALREIERTFQAMAGEDEPYHRLSVQRLIIACTTPDGFSVDKGIAVADLLKEHGDLLAEEGDDEGACASRIRALALYLEAATSGDVFHFGLHAKIDELEEQTETCERPPQVEQKLKARNDR